MKIQSILAIIGGLFLGLVLGAVAGAILVPVQAWEDRELYGFIGFAQRIRGLGIGAVIGALAGGAAGFWFTIEPRANRG